MFELDDIYTDLITEHSKAQEHRHHLQNPTTTERGFNPSCGDDITLEIKLDDGKISELYRCTAHFCPLGNSEVRNGFNSSANPSASTFLPVFVSSACSLLDINAFPFDMGLTS